jgi:hypothetical protein
LGVDHAESVPDDSNAEHRFGQACGLSASELIDRGTFKGHFSLGDVYDDLAVGGQSACLHGARDSRLQLYIALGSA